ncbi:MAG: peptide deformylase [Planctomycetes bacterium]|nr:peptide deformylase [Planctomycetota bacterium]
MEIVLFPDPRLRARNTPIETFDSGLAKLARDMFEVMYRTQGVGLAAPQVGMNVKLLIFNEEGKPEATEREIVLCNPRITSKSKERVSGEEGCLSFPGIYAPVQRHETIVIEAEDLEGNTFKKEFADWEARIFQHEFDHLDGVLFIDRFSPSDKTRLKPRLMDLKRTYQESLADS